MEVPKVQPVCINITGHHVILTEAKITPMVSLGVAPYCHECSEAFGDYVWPCTRFTPEQMVILGNVISEMVEPNAVQS